MVQAGFIRKFTAKPSLVSMGIRSVLVWGRSRLRSLPDGLRAVREDDRVGWAAHSTSGRFYFALHLKSEDDIGERISRLERETMMIRPTHGVRNLFGQEKGSLELGQLEWKILGALAEDHTLTGEEIAARIKKNKKDVTSILDDLISAGAIEFSVDIDPNVVSNPLCMFHLESLEPERVEVAAGELMKARAWCPLLQHLSNIPVLTTTTLSADYEDILDLTRSIQDWPEFPYFEVNLCCLHQHRDVEGHAAKAWNLKEMKRRSRPALRSWAGPDAIEDASSPPMTASIEKMGRRPNRIPIIHQNIIRSRIIKVLAWPGIPFYVLRNVEKHIGSEVYLSQYS